VRHAHVFSSLALSVLFIFYGLTGFMASRPQLFPGEARRTLPSNIGLQQAELSGYLKSRLPADVEVAGFAAEAGRIRVEFAGRTGVRYVVEIDPADRNHTIAEVRRLPELPADARALAETLARQYPGRLDANSLEEDARFIYFNLDSVWAHTAVTVDKTAKTARVQRSGTPWVVALVNLHRGKQAGPLQRVLIDASGLVMVLVTLTGMAFALQSRVRSARWTAIGLIGLSVALAIFMMVNR
jgi:hypothetical protein